jgi:hypothetical protein
VTLITTIPALKPKPFLPSSSRLLSVPIPTFLQTRFEASSCTARLSLRDNILLRWLEVILETTEWTDSKIAIDLRPHHSNATIRSLKDIWWSSPRQYNTNGQTGQHETPIYPKHFCKARSRNVPKNENPDQQPIFSVHTAIFDAKDGSM